MKPWRPLLLCFLLAGCGTKDRLAERETAFISGLQECRAVNDLDRQIVVAKCGEVIDLWQASIVADADAGKTISRFAENLKKSAHWDEFRKKQEIQDNLMRALLDPPERYRTQYEKTLRQHGYLKRLLALLEKPTGSLVSYTAEVRALASDYDQLKAELDVSLPKVVLNPILDSPK